LVQSFAERWRHKEHECGFESIAATMVACGAELLPDAAAPCVTFKEAALPRPIWEAFESHSDWSIADRERVAPYCMIGSDGAGNPICIEQGTGRVVLLDHENRFHTRQFVNSSVRQLAECLLAYMGEDKPERFKSAVRRIDPSALAEGSFWLQETANLG
jgi:hypothetical protein